MQVILMEKVLNLGSIGDVVKVKDGYARNYLIPQGKASRATEANIAKFQAKRAELEAAQRDSQAAAAAQAERLDGLMVQITQKAGIDGKLFGSVTGNDIAEALKALGFDIEKAAVRLPEGPLKHVGDHPVTIALHGEVSAHITVSVLGED